MDTVYKSICKVLNHFDLESSGIQNMYCCLCLVELVENEESLHINDLCHYVYDDDVDHPATEAIATIIAKILGEKIADMMAIFTTVCQKCATSLVNIYRFRKQCELINQTFHNAFANLDDCFQNIPEDLNQYKCLYVSVNMNNSMIEQIYDDKTVPRTSLVSHFKDLVNENNKKRTKVSRNRDFSTIFIKTPELMADPNSNEFKCKICSKVCSSSGSLRQHFFSLHFKKEFECDKCSKSFGTQGLLNTHIKECHSIIYCVVCKKDLQCRSSRRHIMMHKKQKQECTKCGRTYKKRNDFIKHIKQETCKMPSRIAGDYICNDCGKHFKFKYQLTSHIKYEHRGVEAHVCKWCGRKCYTKSALETHVLKHTGVKNFVCDECGGKFVTKQSLLNHSRLHTGERPYPCDQCDQSFLSASRRKEHIERNHSGFRFECDLCGSKCSARRSMLQHRKKHFTSTVES